MEESKVVQLPIKEDESKHLKELRLKKKQQYESQYPGRRIGCVVANTKEYWIVSPTREVWHAFKDAAVDAKRKRVAMENLSVRCALSPSGEELSKLFDSVPALAEVIATHVAELAGYDDKSELVDFGDA